MLSREELEKYRKAGYPYVKTMALDDKPMSAIPPRPEIKLSLIDFSYCVFSESTRIKK